MGEPMALSRPLELAAYAVLVHPLLSFVVNGLWLCRLNWRVSAWTAVALMGGALAAALVLALGYRAEVLAHPELFPAKTAVAWEHVWMPMETGTGVSLSAKLGCYLDPISVMMVLIVTFISFLVNVYSVGYMRDDRGAGRFFPILSFFSFSMLGLVLSSNLAQTFFFWELVGAASYLLIGFWYEKPSAVAAAKKAFILTRVADAFFLIGFL
jgi:NADH-quinone oxidoreductase subunit L